MSPRIFSFIVFVVAVVVTLWLVRRTRGERDAQRRRIVLGLVAERGSVSLQDVVGALTLRPFLARDLLRALVEDGLLVPHAATGGEERWSLARPERLPPHNDHEDR